MEKDFEEKFYVELSMSEKRVKNLILNENRKMFILVLSLLVIEVFTILLNIFH